MANKINIYPQLEKVKNSLWAFSLKLTGDETDARDLYQDTALRIISNADKYQEGTNFKAWAVTIMRNIFINNYRKKVRRGTILDQTPNNYYINSGGQTIENDGETRIAYKELLKMVSALPEDFKRPFGWPTKATNTMKSLKSWMHHSAPSKAASSSLVANSKRCTKKQAW